MLSDRDFRSGVQGISPTASRLSCGKAIILLIQWPNAVPTGTTPKRRALLKILWSKNSFSHPVRTAPSSRAASGCPVDLVSVGEVSMPISAPCGSASRLMPKLSSRRSWWPPPERQRTAALVGYRWLQSGRGGIPSVDGRLQPQALLQPGRPVPSRSEIGQTVLTKVTCVVAAPWQPARPPTFG